MWRSRLRHDASALLLSTVLAAPLAAQGLTGQLAGLVSDADGGVVPGATVTVTSTTTGWTSRLVTGPDGQFAARDLVAGTYDVTVALHGFKTVVHKGITVAATERVTVPRLVLDVGDLAETITVERDVPLVQSTSGARSALITRDTIEDIALKGRDVAGLLALLPGVVDTNPREAPTWSQMSSLTINGRSSTNLSYDGITNKETGSNASSHAAPSVDSIAEVRVQSSNFQAEYGRSSGASVTLITRSGSRDVHGSAAVYVRDAALNGNEFAREEQCRQGDASACSPALYDFDNLAWTLGGPVRLPGLPFNRHRNRLFFFWSQDVLSRTDPGVLTQRRMPTALERSGDFSRTVDARGRLIHVRDPQRAGACNSASGGPACFPGNVIPASRIDPTGQALLNLFPLPNATDPTGRGLYNYTFQPVQDMPRDDQVLRVDWNISSRTRAYGRVQFGTDKRAGPTSFLGFVALWPQMATTFQSDTFSYVTTVLHTINPTTFAEVAAGVNWSHQRTAPMDQAALDANTRATVLPALPRFFQAANPLDLLPNATFTGGTPGVPGAFQYERRFPYWAYNTLWNVSGSVTTIKGAHSLKTGLFVEHTTRPVRQRSWFNGSISFNSDGRNPLNTNIGFANALIGAITSFQQADAQPTGHGRFVNTEFYVQDTWRLRRRLTLDAGVRFYLLTPTSSHGDQVAQFEPLAYDPAAAPLLYQPISTPQGRRAVNPATGEVFPQVYIGRLVPGSGDNINGMRLHAGTPHSTSPFVAAPRLGVAWDVTGDGRTAVRGGWGVFYDRYADNDVLELVELPPLVRTYTVNNTTIPELVDSPLTETTDTVKRFEPFVPPVVYNWSAGIQHEFDWGVTGDLAYVGNAARDQTITREINGRPYGYAYRASSLDPTSLVDSQALPLPDDLLRPYAGYASILQREFTGYADYHSLQVALTRRRAAGWPSVGVAYTYQLVNRTLAAIDPFVDDNRARNDTSAGRRPHTLTVHYSWLVPSRRTSNPVARALADGWQISGVTSWLSGAQGGVTYSFVNPPAGGALAGTGAIGGGPSRPRLICDPTLPRAQRTFGRQFRTECFAAPDDAFRLGTTLGDEIQGPGFVNWDVSVFKHVPMGGNRRLQLRVELYNAFNTRQWTAVYTAAEFDYATGALNNPTVFGSLTGLTNSARRIQVAARFLF